MVVLIPYLPLTYHFNEMIIIVLLAGTDQSGEQYSSWYLHNLTTPQKLKPFFFRQVIPDNF